MITTYFLVKTIHIISSTLLFGTGLGIAFFMWWAHKTGGLPEKVYATRTTVLADFIFTLPSVIIQPLSGIALVMLAGYSWSEMWLVLTYIGYMIAGACWIPVVWIQIQLKQMAFIALQNNTPLPVRYDTLLRLWFYLGWPAFASLVMIFFLMVFKNGLYA